MEGKNKALDLMGVTRAKEISKDKLNLALNSFSGNALEALKEAMIKRGLNPPESFDTSGRLVRFSGDPEKPKKKNSWYVIHSFDQGLIASFGDWRLGIHEVGWKSFNEGGLNKEQRATLKRTIKRQRELLRKEQIQKQKEAKSRAEDIYSEADECKGHPYLESKGVNPCNGLKTIGETLIVPAYDESGTLWTVQRIFRENGAFQKRFLTGGRTKGCFFPIGFNLNENKPIDVFLICEGLTTGLTLFEETGYPVVVAFYSNNLSAVSKALSDLYPHSLLVVCADNDRNTPGNPGEKHGREAAEQAQALFVMPTFLDDESKGTDFNDLAQEESPNAVRLQVKKALSREAIEKLLINLDELSADQKIKASARVLGVSRTTLRDVIKRAYKNEESLKDDFEALEPWPDAVDGLALLDEIRSILKRQMYLPEYADVAIPLWICFTYCFDKSAIMPILGIKSPEKRCGKTKLLDILNGLVFKPLPSSNISAAAIYRVTEKHSPTFLIDEADTFLEGNNELRGLINAGHKRTGGFVWRTNPNTMEPERFSVWCPKSLAKIGDFPETIEDRSIIVLLHRKPSSIKLEKLPLDFFENMQDLRRKLLKWTMDIELNMEPEMPDVGNDRALDNWAPLISIADNAGGEWPELARKAMIALEGSKDEQGIGELLLSDIRNIFKKKDADRISSQELTEELNKLLERPWGDMRRGKGINPSILAKRLKQFGIGSRTIRIGSSKTQKGYLLSDFEEIFIRYLPSEQNVTTSQSTNDGGYSPISKSHTRKDVTAQSVTQEKKNNECDVWCRHTKDDVTPPNSPETCMDSGMLRCDVSKPLSREKNIESEEEVEEWF